MLLHGTASRSAIFGGKYLASISATQRGLGGAHLRHADIQASAWCLGTGIQSESCALQPLNIQDSNTTKNILLAYSLRAAGCSDKTVQHQPWTNCPYCTLSIRLLLEIKADW